MGLPLQQGRAWLSMSWPFLWLMSEQREMQPQYQRWGRGMEAASLRPELQVEAGWEDPMVQEREQSLWSRDRGAASRLIRKRRSSPQLMKNPGLATPEHECAR